jgi:hypothetical protein
MRWAQIVFGWPAIVAAAIFLISGAASRRAWLSAIGALLAVPPLSILGWAALFALVSNWISATLVWRRMRLVAAAFLLPFLFVSIRLAVLVVLAHR